MRAFFPLCFFRLFILLVLGGTVVGQTSPTTLLLQLGGDANGVAVTRVWAKPFAWQAPRYEIQPTGRIDLLDGAGRVLARVPFGLEQFNLHRDQRQGQVIMVGDRVFSPRVELLVKIPDLAAQAATLEIHQLSAQGHILLGRELFSRVTALAAQGQVDANPKVKTILQGGPVQNRYDIVILGDGYQATEETRFNSDCSKWITDLFKREPYKSYKAFFNVHTVFRASVQSGANHPDRTPPVVVNNAYGATYNTGGTARCLYIRNYSQANADAALAPDVEGRIVVFVNDSRYGGCAGTYAVSYNGSSASVVQSHEFGHSFGRLADEYDYGRTGTYTGSEPSAANITADPTGKTKWPLWMNYNQVGVYEGAGYYKKGLYRPKSSCLMRSLGAPLCEVCGEQTLKQCYVKTIPLEGMKPTGKISISSYLPVTASFTDLTPGGGKVTWYLDNQVVQQGGSSFQLVPATLTNGSHTLKVQVQDQSVMVRKDPTGMLTNSHSWPVDVALGSSLHTLYRITGTSGTGVSLASPGDIDRDGADDLLAGSQGEGCLISGATGRNIYTLKGISGLDTVVAQAGDLDQDNWPDLFLAFPDDLKAAGSLQAISGKDGIKKILSLQGNAAGDRFGAAICALGDINKDQYPDFAVAAPKAGGRGKVTFYCGRTSKAIRTLTGSVPGADFGHALARLGDLDNDSIDDLLITSPGAGLYGTATIYSGGKGLLIRQVQGFVTGSGFGLAAAGPGDITGDGIPDLVIGAPKAAGYGAVLVFSGSNGYLHQYLLNKKPNTQFGAAVVVAGDQDGDGVKDILVGAPLEGSGGAIHLLSGKSGDFLQSLVAPGMAGNFGQSLAGGLDVNGDGILDFAAGAPGIGQVELISNAKLLKGSSLTISVANGGLEKLTIAAGSVHGGKTYILLGSMTGVSPGAILDKVHLPLIFDPYTDLTILFANSGLFPQSFGILDGQGRATPSIAIPGATLHSTMAGLTLHHAALILGQGTFDLATNPQPLALQP